MNSLLRKPCTVARSFGASAQLLRCRSRLNRPAGRALSKVSSSAADAGKTRWPALKRCTARLAVNAWRFQILWLQRKWDGDFSFVDDTRSSRWKPGAVSHRRQQQGRTHGRSVRTPEIGRRSLPVQRRVSDTGASQANARHPTSMSAPRSIRAGAPASVRENRSHLCSSASKSRSGRGCYYNYACAYTDTDQLARPLSRCRGSESARRL